jgi:hypothetical protein
MAQVAGEIALHRAQNTEMSKKREAMLEEMDKIHEDRVSLEMQVCT